jgi:ribosomal protein S18 acetylase RimI-like enzyme
MAQETLAVCSRLKWDSSFFGFPIALAPGETLSERKGLAILEWAQAHSIRCLYFLADANSATTANAAYRLDFKFVDVRVELSLASNAREPFKVPSFELRTARASDVDPLEAIAREAHRDSRFFFDVNFPKERAEDLFATWIAADCRGRADMVLTVEHQQGRPLGYVTCNLSKDSHTGRIGLVGVGAGYRGKGVGKALISGALQWFWSAGAKKVFVVTQARNIAAQRLYQAAGFRVDNVRVWYHRWF